MSIAGSVLAGVSFAIGFFAMNVEFLYVFIGVLGGIGFGLVYVPAVVAVGFYFEKRRALATGIAVCGSGIGTFVLAPLTTWLLENYGWRGTILIFVSISLSVFSYVLNEAPHCHIRSPVYSAVIIVLQPVCCLTFHLLFSLAKQGNCLSKFV